MTSNNNDKQFKELDNLISNFDSMLDKLHNILNGFKNYIFEDKAVESLAKARAIECAKCPKAVWGMIPQMFEDEIEEIKGLKCDWCECPLSTKLRSVDEKCPENKWTR